MGIVLNQSFKNRLIDDGFSVEDIEQDILLDRRRKPSPSKVIRGWTGFPNNVIRQGLFDEAKDILQPKIGRALLQILTPWIINEDLSLPSIKVKEITRRSGLSRERVIYVLTRYVKYPFH